MTRRTKQFGKWSNAEIDLFYSCAGLAAPRSARPRFPVSPRTPATFPSRSPLFPATSATKNSTRCPDARCAQSTLEAGVFDPHAVRILLAAFDGAWQSIKASGAKLSDKQIELVRENLAKYIIEQARHGELDECRLRDGALLHLARSNLRH